MPKHVFYTGHGPRYALVHLGPLIADSPHPHPPRAAEGERKFSYETSDGPVDTTSSIDHIVLDVENPEAAVKKFQTTYHGNSDMINDLYRRLNELRTNVFNGAINSVKEFEAFGDG